MAESFQVDKSGNIIRDVETRVSKKYILEKLKNVFSDKIQIGDVLGHSVFVYQDGNKEIYLLSSRVSYLGLPHPMNKKRIQLKKRYKDIFDFKIDNPIISYLIVGIYVYKENFIIFVFDPTNFINRNINNSSVHVNTQDIIEATKKGKFQRIDKNGNDIKVFDLNNFRRFIESNVSFSNKNLDNLVDINTIEAMDDFVQKSKILKEKFKKSDSSLLSKIYYCFLKYKVDNPNSSLFFDSDASYIYFDFGKKIKFELVLNNANDDFVQLPENYSKLKFLCLLDFKEVDDAYLIQDLIIFSVENIDCLVSENNKLLKENIPNLTIYSKFKPDDF